ncbi:hypothetical protein K402DRAFT_380588 [Aulographum hederae CBS 113979]|uniref:C2H2-type domain-containing protein n=1 Tax=Aulographum hederae CBS 113979 TaxID=1176131 RepID=A0A6G1GVI1_9PEZI|nr:hypothetical protein K402DRAFT_380588 [Aulographum hederae CBS 113979]
MEDSPGSPLSELSSDDFTEDIKASDHYLNDMDTMRPAKRQRLTAGGNGSGPADWNASSHAMSTAAGGRTAASPSPSVAISEDTDGSVPGSPTHLSHIHGGITEAEDAMVLEQVSVCKWDGCTAGDLGNMDRLVDHLHDEHIHARQKKYSCEWTDCSRRGIPHASGYALRAHMRSHTREKPFYCTLPECDRSFTRSDALAKHMRTVHETEALRPSDPVPKHHSSNPTNKSQRLRLTVSKGLGPADNRSDGKSTPASPSVGPTVALPANASELDYENHNVAFVAPSAYESSEGVGYTKQFPPDIHFTAEELALPASDLYRLLRRQLLWATRDAEELAAEVKELEAQKKEEWMAKELVLENVMEAEMGAMEEAWGAKKTDIREAVDMDEEVLRRRIRDDAKPGKELTVVGDAAWRREKDEEGKEQNGNGNLSRNGNGDQTPMEGMTRDIVGGH